VEEATMIVGGESANPLLPGARLSKVANDLKDRKVVAIACGPNTTFAVTDAGEVWAWGSNAGGVLCQNSSRRLRNDNASSKPLLIESMLGIKVVQVSSRAASAPPNR